MFSSQKTFRVFISSTFTDMRAERKILQNDVFPLLKAICESKGTSFQDVDLRWGVNEEAQLDQKTMDICLGEIVRCQKLSPKPNFIILLGDKYGWQPVPARIPSSEMGQIFKQLSEDEKDVINQWYWEDFNALPPEFVLQPRKGDYLSYEAWKPIEVRILNILRMAVASLRLTEEQKLKYFASATHQEIVRGAFDPLPDVIGPEEHVFAYLRTIKNLPENDTTKNFIDVANSSRDGYSKAQLEKLKEDLITKLPDSHIHPYNAFWVDGCVLDDPKAFGERVYADLSSVIESQLEGMEDVDPLTREIKQHQDFKEKRLKHFTGRQEALQSMTDYLNGPINKVFSVIGSSGSGKTSLMAKAIEEASDRQGIKVFRFLGTTSATSDSLQLLSGLIREIASAYGIEINSLLKEGEDETKVSSLRGLQEIFSRCLNLTTKEKPLTIFLDALDQLFRDYTELALDWMPKEIPEYVKIIVSALPELKEKLIHTETYNLGTMPVKEGEELLQAWLTATNRTLQPCQMQEVMNRFTVSGIPLYLKLVFEKAREWHSYSANIALKPDIDGVLNEYFNGLEKNHNSILVEKVCRYLLSGKYQGLMEQEILDLLVFDQEYWDHFLVHCHPDHRIEVEEMGKLPIIVWSRLFLDLEPYLTNRDADGLPLISFYHRKFLEHTKERYLPSNSPDNHRILARYFEKASLYLDEGEERPNVRKVVEQPYQETLSEKWTDIAEKTLANFPFLMAKTKANIVEGILGDYTLLWDRAPESLKENLDLWRAFFTERAHILRRGNAEWPAYKILLQLAIEHADDSPLTVGAEQWLVEGLCDWLWIHRVPRPPHVQKNLCLLVFEGHTEKVRGVLELADGRLLSWSNDKTTRLWDSQSGTCLSVFEGHPGEVLGVLRLADGRLLSFSRDRTLRVWDGQSGACLVVLKGHTDSVNGVIELADGRLLSWSRDRTLRVWDGQSGACLVVLKGHTDSVNGAIELDNSRLLSWSRDYTLKLWDGERGVCLATLEGHTGEVSDTLVLSDGRLLSWARGSKNDTTLRVWDGESGACLVVLEGHTDSIYGAIELADGRLLSWSYDNTLRVWDSQNGTQLVVLKGHTGPIFGVLVLPGGQLLSWADHTLRLWEGQRGICLAVFEGHTGLVDDVKVLADRRVISTSHDFTMRLWDVQSHACLAVLTGHSSFIGGITVLPDGQILSWSRDRTLRVWDGKSGKCLRVLEGHSSEVRYGIALADGRLLSWADDRTFRLWDGHGNPSTAVFERHTDSVSGLLTIADGRLLSWSSNDKTLRLWDSKSGKCLMVLKGHTEGILCAMTLADGRLLSWSWDNTLRVWDSQSGTQLVVLKGHTGPIDGAVVLAGGRLLSWSADETLMVWDSHSGVCLAVLEGHTEQVEGALALFNGRLLSWSGHSLRLWDEWNGACLKTMEGHTGTVWSVLVLTNGRLLSCSTDHTLRLWDGQSGACVATFEGHTKWVVGALELDDGRILSWSNDCTLRLWDGESAVCLKVLEGHTSYINGAVPLPDGQLLSWSDDKTMRLWDSQSGDCLEATPEEQIPRRHPDWFYAQKKAGDPNNVGVSWTAPCVLFRSYGKLFNFSSVIVHDFFFTSLDSFGQLRHRTSPIPIAVWNAVSVSALCCLLPDGMAAVTQKNGQVCSLKLNHGQRHISIAEAEALLAQLRKKT